MKNDSGRWRAIRDTVNQYNSFCEAGAIIHTAERPNPDWEPADGASEHRPPLPKPDEPIRMPMAGMRFVPSKSGPGRPVYGFAAHDRGEARVAPMWKYVGAELNLVGGELRRPGTKFTSTNWPRDPDLEPVNDAAKAVAKYFAAHRNNARLPTTAWDDDAQAVNKIGTSAHRPSAGAGSKIPPRTYRRAAKSSA